MKTNITYLLLIAALTVTIASCSSNDDELPANNSEEVKDANGLPRWAMFCITDTVDAPTGERYFKGWIDSETSAALELPIQKVESYCLVPYAEVGFDYFPEDVDFFYIGTPITSIEYLEDDALPDASPATYIAHIMPPTWPAAYEPVPYPLPNRYWLQVWTAPDDPSKGLYEMCFVDEDTKPLERPWMPVLVLGSELNGAAYERGENISVTVISRAQLPGGFVTDGRQTTAVVHVRPYK